MVGRALAPAAQRISPEFAAGLVRQALELAIDGVGTRLPGVKATAAKRLDTAAGDVDQAIRDTIESHVRLAGAQGFLTNLGGVVTLTFTIPANVTGLALLQCHLVATIAHLRGYDVEDPRVRTAILTCLLGEDNLKSLMRQGRIPTSPMAIATAPEHDPELAHRTAIEVTADMLTKVSGKRIVTAVGRRTPLIGGGIGAVADGFSTWQVGRYAERALLSRGAK
ncbi:MAG: hypothetical protein GEU93_05370 [Propionibacteriales bacterium]|nr:hypothetical protein [Propionibacteriales bacterium]